MSEYQYYEFRAIDKPLDRAAMNELRAITSRAEITPTSLVNEYHWGDFRGDPDKLMDKYFDAFLYFANWGTHRLMFRVPLESLDGAELKQYSVPCRIETRRHGGHWVLEFNSPEDCRDEEWRQWQLSGMMPLRADLLAGDLRCLYLAWLSCVEYRDVDEDAVAPPMPPGLRKLTGPLKEFAEFMYLDEQLIAAASTDSTAAPTEPDETAIRAWVAALPEPEKNSLLAQTMAGEGGRVGANLLTRMRRALRPRDDGADGPRRTAGELLAALEARQSKAAERAAREREENERRQAAARAEHLQSLAGKEEELWREVDKLVQTKERAKYDQAVSLLTDLRDLAHGSDEQHFTKSLRELFAKHASKTAFRSRATQAGLTLKKAAQGEL
jgi:hypothetical protein